MGHPALIPFGAGAHVDGQNPLDEAAARSADLVQIFLADPQSWHKPPPRADANALIASPIPIVVHAPYLINVAAEASRIRIPSRRILAETCDAAAAIGAVAVVVHGGHLTGDGPIADAYPRWRKALLELDTEVPVLIENTATGENAVARRLDSIERLWAEIGDLNPGFVLDTCHAWAGGEPCEDLPSRVRAITGRIDLVHCNDSRDLFDSHRDRHANVGAGEIPEALLASMIADSRAPVIVETPGGVQEHLADIAWVRTHMADLSAT